MKSVFVAGSRKFYGEIEDFVRMCTEKGIKAETAGKIFGKPDTLKSERSALLRAFKRIERSDAVYVVAKDGYIGKTVAMEIAYAFSRKKTIASSEMIEDLAARGLVSKVMPPGRFVKSIPSRAHPR